jgi:hypothetical protein
MIPLVDDGTALRSDQDYTSNSVKNALDDSNEQEDLIRTPLVDFFRNTLVVLISTSLLNLIGLQW